MPSIVCDRQECSCVRTLLLGSFTTSVVLYTRVGRPDEKSVCSCVEGLAGDRGGARQLAGTGPRSTHLLSHRSGLLAVCCVVSSATMGKCRGAGCFSAFKKVSFLNQNGRMARGRKLQSRGISVARQIPCSVVSPVGR